MSLASQQEALSKSFGANPDVQIVGVYEEAKSAKTPGRPVFAEMLDRIEAGEADGIASWAPDRLARNSIDGGRIIYMLDCGVLRDLKFATYTFENNSQGKFMLGIMFNQSKYYSDALSENVKRGNATKVAMGWRPNKPPIGYLNCPVTRTIIADPDLFPFVRCMFELLLKGNLSPREIALMARDEWGLRTPKRHVRGGTPLTLSAVYKMFANPFYKGQILWGSVLYPGKHPRIVSAQEFARVQAILGREGKARPQKHQFAFTGLMRCGACGLRITAETRRNAYNSIYTYYHCTRRGLGPRCREPAATADQIVDAFAEFLRSLTIPEPIENWVRDQLANGENEASKHREAILASRSAAVAELTTQLQELHRLRVRRMIDDVDYIAERDRLAAEREGLSGGEPPEALDRFELFAHVVSFSKYAVDWFRDSDPATQRMIVEIAGSNFLLTGKKLSGEAIFPLRQQAETSNFVQLCTEGEDVRTTPVKEARVLLKDITSACTTNEGRELLDGLKALHFRLGVSVGGSDHSATHRGHDRSQRVSEEEAPPRQGLAKFHTPD